MTTNLSIALLDLVTCLAEAVDLISPSLARHHQQVAFIAYSLAQELQLTPQAQADLYLAGALHDIGALSLQERIGTLQFEFEEGAEHERIASDLLQQFPPLQPIARIIRHHHTYWEHGEGEFAPLASHIIHLADRVAVLIKKERNILSQKESILARISAQKNKMFHPGLVKALHSLAKKESFWFDTIYDTNFSQTLQPTFITLNLEQLADLAALFAKVIDFRSPFTATHSAGVAATAAKLAELASFKQHEVQLMHVAGHLHDLGKLAIPKEILEKPGKLTPEEYNLIKSHTYYSYRLLQNIPGLETINTWASLHHEHLDGSGYPFKLSADKLTPGSRIMAVADVFTAIAEDRPYRRGMAEDEMLRILYNLAAKNHLDREIVELLKENLPAINDTRLQAQELAHQSYGRVIAHH